MDIRKRKLKGHIALSVLIIVCMLLASAMYFFVKNIENDYSGNINKLEWQEAINKPVIETGKGVQYHSSTQYESGTSKVSYKLLESDLIVTETSSTSLSITTAANSQYKYAYVDFNTKLNVPAYTEYDVKYKFTYTVKRNSSGSVRVYSTLYDFGKDYTEDSPKDDKINLEELDKTYDTDIFIGNSTFIIGDDTFEYAKDTINTNTSSASSTTYEINTTLTNYSEEGVDFLHNYGVFIFGNSGTSNSITSMVSVTATIKAKEAGEEPPTDVSTEYTGEALSLADVDDSQKEWYDSDIMTPDYSQNADMINFGDKTVKITVKDSIFKGDGKANESKTVRYITFTITKKKISASITKSEDGKSLVANAITGEVYSGDTEGNGRAPTFGITYTSTDGKGYDSTTYPDKVGKYKAVASITNDCNYQLDADRVDEYTYTFEITKTEVTKPTKPLSNLTYNGQEQEFELLNISDIAKVTITPKTSGLTDAGNGKFKAKNAGDYYVTVALKDNGVATKWKDTTDDIGSYDLKLTIDKANLSVNFVTPDGGWTWTSDTAQTVSVTDSRKSNGDKADSLTYKVYLDNNQISSSNVSADADNSKQTNIALSKLPSKTEKYTLKVELDTTAGDGKNYNPVTITQTFNVTDKEIKVEDKNIIWSYFDDKGNKVTLTLEQWSPSTTYDVLIYTGKEYEFTATLDGLDENDEVRIDKYTTPQSGTNAGDYTTTVTLTSSKGKLTKSTFTLKWKINKAKFDLSDVKWDYDPEKPLEYIEDTFQSVKLINLPEGLEFEYEDNRKMNVNEKYTATIGEITVSDDLKDNYVKPDPNDPSTYICKQTNEHGETVDKAFLWTCDWQIKKAVLDLSWTRKTTIDGNSRKIRTWEVRADNFGSNKVEYKYYRASDVVNGKPVDGAVAVDYDTLEVVPEVEVKYYVFAVVKSGSPSNYDNNYEIKEGTQYKQFTVGSQAPEREISIDSEFTYNGNAHGVLSEWNVSSTSNILYKYYSLDEGGNKTLLSEAPTNAGKYVIELDIEEGFEDAFELSQYELKFEIVKVKITAKWDTTKKTPTLSGTTATENEVIEYEYTDEEGNVVDVANLEAGKTYKVKAKIKSGYENNYAFVDEQGVVLTQPTVTDEQSFEIKAENNNDPTEPTTPVTRQIRKTPKSLRTTTATI